MPACPACATEVADDATECPRCHLAVHLFDAVREAVGLPESDPSYAAEVRALLDQVDPEGPPALPVAPGGAARLAYPARFPAPVAPGRGYPDVPGPARLEVLPALPALPAGGVAGLRHQLDDYLHLGGRLGVDVAGMEPRIREAILVDDAHALEALVRELFVRLAAGLSEEYEALVGQRTGLSTLIGTGPIDSELGLARDALGRGDLEGTERRLRGARESLAGLEEEWATVQILLAECDLLAETTRELGGDPSPALGPLEEGRRIARTGDRSAAEPVLAKAALALWAVLNPRFGPEMHRVKDALLAKRSAGDDLGRALPQFRELSQHLAHRNFGAAIVCYRWLREFVASPSPPGAGGEPTEAPLSPTPK